MFFNTKTSSVSNPLNGYGNTENVTSDSKYPSSCFANVCSWIQYIYFSIFSIYIHSFLRSQWVLKHPSRYMWSAPVSGSQRAEGFFFKQTEGLPRFQIAKRFPKRHVCCLWLMFHDKTKEKTPKQYMYPILESGKEFVS